MSTHLNMDSILQRAQESRDDEWEKAFLHIFAESRLRILEEQPQQGPDGMPYLMVSIDNEGTEPAAKVLSWLCEKGIGMVVNPFGTMPDYVFTFGQIWNFKERGVFNSEFDTSKLGQFKLEKGQKVHVGEPSKEYLPDYIREILRAFFKNIGRDSVKIIMMSQDKEHYDLCLSLESLGSPEKHEHRGILETISWFLPGHYSLAMVTEKGMPDFYNL